MQRDSPLCCVVHEAKSNLRASCVASLQNALTSVRRRNAERDLHTGAVSVKWVDADVQKGDVKSTWDPVEGVKKQCIPDVSPHDVKILTSYRLRENPVTHPV